MIWFAGILELMIGSALMFELAFLATFAYGSEKTSLEKKSSEKSCSRNHRPSAGRY